jgi:hypothetical protein
MIYFLKNNKQFNKRKDLINKRRKGRNKILGTIIGRFFSRGDILIVNF